MAKSHSSSAVHHHGEQDTAVYALRGRGAVVWGGGKKRQDLAPGDFALIPARTEHQEVNDGDEEVSWIITRSGRMPIVEDLGGWGPSKRCDIRVSLAFDAVSLTRTHLIETITILLEIIRQIVD